MPLHAAVWGGSSSGADGSKDYPGALEQLIQAGPDIDDRRHFESRTPLRIALISGNRRAIELLRSLGAPED